LHVKPLLILLPELESTLVIFWLFLFLLDCKHALLAFVVLELLLSLVLVPSHLVHDLRWKVDIINFKVFVTPK